MSEARLSSRERRQMRDRLRKTHDAHHYRRLLAILEHDRGESIADIAQRLNVSRQSVHEWMARYREQRCVDDLRDAPHPGRPTCAGDAFDTALRKLLRLAPQQCGYRATHWTVRLLRDQLRQDLQQEYSDDTIRRGLHRLGYVWKRPRYVLAPDPQREKKTPNSARRVWFAQTQRGAG
jgi:transposase